MINSTPKNSNRENLEEAVIPKESRDPGLNNSPSTSPREERRPLSFKQSVQRWFNDWVIKEANISRPFVLWGKRNRWNDSCLLLLPNIRRQNIVVMGIENVLKQYFNISRKDRQVQLYGWRGRKYNKYLRAMYSRLTKARRCRDLLEPLLLPSGDIWELQNGKNHHPVNNDYWNLALYLMNHSTVFQVVHANKVLNKERTWPGKVPLKHVLRYMNSVRRSMREGNWMELTTHRVWIDEDKRPLGVPSTKDRIIGSMLSNLLEHYLWDSIRLNHGYQTGKGTGTAWQWILGNGQHYEHLEDSGEGGLIRYPYIWEYDYEGCFNRLDQRTMGYLLQGIGLPSWLWMSLLRMQKRAPTISSDSGGETEEIETSTNIRIQTQRGSKKKFDYIEGQSTQGVAQGHSISPLLSLLMIDHCNRSFALRMRQKGKWIEGVGYADDGGWATVEPFPEQEYFGFTRTWGIYPAPDKCGYIRFAYQWIKPFKFLGLMYNPFKDQLQAWTRKGSRVVLERSATKIYSHDPVGGQPLFRVEGGIFHREEKYEKLGDWYEFNQSILVSVIAHFWLPLIIAIILPELSWAVIIYYSLHQQIPKYYAALSILGTISPPLCLFALLLVLLTSSKKWPLEMFQHEYCMTQQITWRLSMRSWWWNGMIARMYNGNLEDTPQYQDFKLQCDKGSLLWHLRNTETDQERWVGWEHFKIRINKTMWKLIEEDMENDINFANATSLGCVLLVEHFADQPVGSCPNPQALEKKLLDRLQLGGYWVEIEAPWRKAEERKHHPTAENFKEGNLEYKVRKRGIYVGDEKPIQNLALIPYDPTTQFSELDKYCKQTVGLLASELYGERTVTGFMETALSHDLNRGVAFDEKDLYHGKGIDYLDAVDKSSYGEEFKYQAGLLSDILYEQMNNQETFADRQLGGVGPVRKLLEEADLVYQITRAWTGARLNDRVRWAVLKGEKTARPYKRLYNWYRLAGPGGNLEGFIPILRKKAKGGIHPFPKRNHLFHYDSLPLTSSYVLPERIELFHKPNRHLPECEDFVNWRLQFPKGKPASVPTAGVAADSLAK